MKIYFFDDVLEQIKYTDNSFNEFRQHLVYNQYFYYITNNIIKEHLSEPYLAVHWRRTDFLLARRNVLNVNRNKEYLVNKCKSILEKYNLKYIFLATDSKNKNEIEYLYNNLPIININNIKNIYQNIDNIIIETLLCVNSNVFYGTKTSLFTKNIMSLRTIKNNNLNFYIYIMLFDIFGNSIEKFTENKENTEFLALVGNLATSGTIKAKDFIKEDGSSVKEVHKLALPKNFKVEDNKTEVLGDFTTTGEFYSEIR
jgi:hypothetical protein